MKPSLTLLIPSLVAACFLSGCFVGKWRPAPLVQGSRTDPATDFARLRQLFETNGGQLVRPEDDGAEVRWRETTLFRLYELQAHTVVIFPYNWTPSHFEMIVFAGHLKPGVTDIAHAIYVDYDSKTMTFFNNTIDFALTPPHLSDIRLGGYCFGQAHADAAKVYDALLHKIWNYSTRGGREQGKLRMDTFMGSPNRGTGELESTKGLVRIDPYFVNGRLVYMYLVLNSPGIYEYQFSPPKGGYEIQATGRFTLTRPPGGKGTSPRCGKGVDK